MPNLIEDNFGAILTILLNLGAILLCVGVYKNKLDTLELMLKRIDEYGSVYTRERVGTIQQQAEYHERRLGIVEAQTNESRKVMSEIHTSVKVIEAWIQTQQK